jgi:hypothetical protein
MVEDDNLEDIVWI